MNRGMYVRIKKIPPTENETIEIYCHEVNDNINEIVSFIKSRQGRLEGQIEDRKFGIPYADIFYIEAVENRVFIYSENQVYETKLKLYELEDVLEKESFLRVSKSTIVNLMKIEAIKPALNGRFLALLKNGIKIIISRKYVQKLKNVLYGRKLK